MEERMVRMYRTFDVNHDAEPSAEAKDRLSACRFLADTLMEGRYKQTADFPKFLSIAVSGLLLALNDPDSDVRLAADESLNKVLKTHLDMHQGRIQLELYKHIKKNNAPVRSLRAAMLKFAELSPLTRPAKRTVFLNSLITPLVMILGRVDSDVLQGTLQHFIPVICKEFGLHFDSGQMQTLLDACTDNITSTSPVARRAAAACVAAMFRYCPGGDHFIPSTMQRLAQIVSAEEVTETDVLGVYGCLNAILAITQS
ncbi:hypothetical protein SARC_16237, partial [Sphaeroforma arctica JP610]